MIPISLTFGNRSKIHQALKEWSKLHAPLHVRPLVVLPKQIHFRSSTLLAHSNSRIPGRKRQRNLGNIQVCNNMVRDKAGLTPTQSKLVNGKFRPQGLFGQKRTRIQLRIRIHGKTKFDDIVLKNRFTLYANAEKYAKTWLTGKLWSIITL